MDDGCRIDGVGLERRSAGVVWPLLALGIVSGIGAAERVFGFEFYQTYHELLTGRTGADGGFKLTDYAALAAGAAVAVLTLLIGLLCSWRRDAHARGVARTALGRALVWGAVPLAVWIAGEAGGAAIAGPFVLTLIVGWACLLGAALVRGRSSVADAERTIGGVVASVLLGGLGVLAVLAAYHRVTNGQTRITPDLALAIAGAGAGVPLLIALVTRVFFSRGFGRGGSPARFALIACQAVGAVGVVALVPGPVVFADDPVAQRVYGGTPGLWAIAGAVCLAGWIDLTLRIRRARRRSRGGGDAGLVVSPLCLLGPLTLLIVGNLEPTIWHDNYHFGEIALLGWLWHDHGIWPYAGYDPARGAIMHAPGVISEWLLDGTAASFGVSMGVAIGLIAMPIFLVLRRVLGVAIAFVAVVVTVQLGREPLAIGLAYVCWFCWAFRRVRPSTWVALWPALGTPLLVIAPAPIAAGIIATMPLGALAAWRALRSEPARALILWASVGLAGAAVLLLTPAGESVLGVIAYARSHAPINTNAHAQMTRPTMDHDLHIPYAFFEIMRMGWVAAIPLSLGVLAWAWVRWGRVGAARVWVLAVPLAVMFVIMLPRISSRMSEARFSMAGYATLMVLAVVLPALLLSALGAWRGRRVAVLAVASACFVAVLNNLATGLARIDPLTVATRAVRVGSIPDPIDGAAIGVPRFGLGTGYPEHAAFVADFVRLSEIALEPGETFLDLGNHNAMAFYTERPPAPTVAAPYNIPSEEQQRAALDAVVARDIEFVLGTRPKSDGFPTSSRAAFMYRYVVARFEPIAVDGHLVYARGGALERLRAYLETDEATPGDLPRELAWMNTRKLFGQASAWGRSLDALSGSFLVHAPGGTPQPGRVGGFTRLDDGWFGVAAPNPKLELGIPGGVNPREAGVLVVRLEIGAEDAGAIVSRGATDEDCPTLCVLWRAEGQGFDYGRSVVAEVIVNDRPGGDAVRSATLVFPLDAVSGWLLSEEVVALRLDLTGLEGVSSLRVAEMSWHQRAGAAWVDGLAPEPTWPGVGGSASGSSAERDSGEQGADDEGEGESQNADDAPDAEEVGDAETTGGE